MARRLVFFLVRESDEMVLEVSEFIHDCFDERKRHKLKGGEYRIDHEWREVLK